MRISNPSCEDELSWSNVLRHLKEDYRRSADVVFCCGDGGTVEGNLLLMSRSSKLLQNIVADLPSYQGSLEAEGLLKIVLPNHDRSMVEQWIHLIYEGTVSVSGRAQVVAFTEFLEKVVVFTGDCKLSLDNPAAASAGGGADIRILSFASLAGAELINTLAPGHRHPTPDASAMSDEILTFADGLCPAESQAGRKDVCDSKDPLAIDFLPPGVARNGGASVFAEDICDLKDPGVIHRASDAASATTGLFKCNDAAASVGKAGPKGDVCSKPKSPKSMECPNCGQRVKNINQLLLHASSKHYAEPIMHMCTFVRKSDLSCRLCRTKYKGKSALVQHVGLKHGALGHIATGKERAFFSRIDRNYTAYCDLMRKKKLHLVKCPECISLFSSLPRLYEHSAARHYHHDLIAHYGKEGACGVCGDGFAGSRGVDLAVHYGSVHKKIEDMMTPEKKKIYEEAMSEFERRCCSRTKARKAPSNRFPCPECSGKFAKLSDLYKHASRCHYRELIQQKCESLYDEKTGCHICYHKLKSRSISSQILHFGATHKMVLQFMDEETRKQYASLESKISASWKSARRPKTGAAPCTIKLLPHGSRPPQQISCAATK